MKTLLTAIAAITATALAATAAEEPKTDAKPKRDLDAMFKKLDANADNSVSKDEFVAKRKDAAKAEAAFGKRDKDGDGKITLEEFKTRGAKKES